MINVFNEFEDQPGPSADDREWQRLQATYLENFGWVPSTAGPAAKRAEQRSQRGQLYQALIAAAVDEAKAEQLSPRSPEAAEKLEAASALAPDLIWAPPCTRD